MRYIGSEAKKRKRLKSQLDANYYGEMDTNNDGATRPSGYFKKGGGTVANLGFEKELVALSGPLGTLTLRTGVINLFDTANEMYRGYPGPGRGFHTCATTFGMGAREPRSMP